MTSRQNVPPVDCLPSAFGPSLDPHPSPVIMSRPITASVRAQFLPNGGPPAAERAARKIHAAIMTQVEAAWPGIAPEDAAQLLELAEQELQFTTHPDGSVSMSVSFNVTTRRTA